MPLKGQGRRQGQTRVTHCRVTVGDNERMQAVSKRTGMGTADQIREMLDLKEYVYQKGLVPKRMIRGVLTQKRPEKRFQGGGFRNDEAPGEEA